MALPALRGWQWVTLISPVFVALLLLRVSGVPLLEKAADEKWGGQLDYEAYKHGRRFSFPVPLARADGNRRRRTMMTHSTSRREPR